MAPQSSVLDDIVIVNGGSRLPIPHVGRILVSAVQRSDDRRPLCILLPSIDGVAEFTAVIAALECLRTDFPAARSVFVDQLRPGMRVRALPEGSVFVVGERQVVSGIDGVFLHYTEKKTRRSQGRRLVPVRELVNYEPTMRKLPISRGGTRPAGQPPTEVDRLSGADARGNSGLYRSRIALVGFRTEFEKVLDGVSLARSGSIHGLHGPGFAASFAWGAFDADGRPFVIHPGGSAGLPLVTLARDLAELEKPCLAAPSEARSWFVLAARLDTILQSLDMAKRIGERQRLVLLAEARRRSEVELLLKHGWCVWEPGPSELLPLEWSGIAPVVTGLPGLDRCQNGAYAEMLAYAEGDHGVSFLEVPSAELAAAFVAMKSLGLLLASEAAADDERMEKSSDLLTDTFFQAANWIETPDGEPMRMFRAGLRRLGADRSYLERHLGAEAGKALDAFMTGIEAFAALYDGGRMTPKGQAILDRAMKERPRGAPRHILMTGSGGSREVVDALLKRRGTKIPCLVGGERPEEDGLNDITAFSILGRDRFRRFIDPWPGGRIAFVGYRFEIDMYRGRLWQREKERAGLGVDVPTRTALTGMGASLFGGPTRGSLLPQQPDGSPVDLDRVIERKKPIRIPPARPGEASQEARVVRFTGRSWMAMSDEHRSVCLVPTASGSRARATLQELEVEELRPGLRIILREGSDKDVIRAVAETRAGREKYEGLRKEATLWRDAIVRVTTDPRVVIERLERVGVRRHLLTVRLWLSDTSIIGPRSEDDVHAIAEAFPLPGKTEAAWDACISAISEVRGMHMAAGSLLTRLLEKQVGQMLFESAECEIAIDLELGMVWLLEIAEIENAPRSVSSSIVNRLQWLDPAWRDRLLHARIRPSGA